MATCWMTQAGYEVLDLSTVLARRSVPSEVGPPEVREQGPAAAVAANPIFSGVEG